jgi:hypothetical protein
MNNVACIPPTPERDRLRKMVVALRNYLQDDAETNHLIEGEEFSDTQLQTFLLMALDYYNNVITPISIKATVMTFPSFALWMDGASVYALKSAIHRFNRNSFQYNDSGTQVAVEEKAVDYERTLQRALQEFRSSAQAVKENINLEQCYGGFSSEYLDLYIIDLRTHI